MTTRILLLRHAKTAAPHLFHGAESDVELGPEGRQQALSAAGRLVHESPSAVYCSSMRRAIQTAEPIAEACGLSVQIEQGIHERAMGHLSGTAWSDTRTVHEQTMKSWSAGDLIATHPSGESYQQMHDRILPVFHSVASRHERGVVVMVAHGMVIRVLISTLIRSIGRSDIGSIPIEHVGVFNLRQTDSGWILAEFPAIHQAADSSIRSSL